jgi:hypothetical protein
MLQAVKMPCGFLRNRFGASNLPLATFGRMTEL